MRARSRHRIRGRRADPGVHAGPGSPAPLARATADARYRVAFCRGDRCPHCGGRDIRPWGRYSGRRRFRCRGCRRTFSTFTGTPLHYLKHPERWPRFLRAMDDRDSVRTAARALRVHPSTAFRWRHRYLADRRRRDGTIVAGRVHLETLWLAENRKGRRSSGRPPRSHGYRYPSHVPERCQVVVAFLWQDDAATVAFASAPGRGGGPWLRDAVQPRLDHVSELITALAVGTQLEREMARRGRGLSVVAPLFAPGPRPVRPWIARRYRHWVSPFRGVATRYLDHYLQWFRDDITGGLPTARRDRPPRCVPPKPTPADHAPPIPLRRTRGSGPAPVAPIP